MPIILCFILGFIILPLNASPLHITGYAYDNDKGNLIYKELHIKTEQLHTVYYAKNDASIVSPQSVFASKQISYLIGRNQPDVEFDNTLCDERYRISHKADGNIQIAFNNSCNKKSSKKHCR